MLNICAFISKTEAKKLGINPYLIQTMVEIDNHHFPDGSVHYFSIHDAAKDPEYQRLSDDINYAKIHVSSGL